MSAAGDRPGAAETVARFDRLAAAPLPEGPPRPPGGWRPRGRRLAAKARALRAALDGRLAYARPLAQLARLRRRARVGLGLHAAGSALALAALLVWAPLRRWWLGLALALALAAAAAGAWLAARALLAGWPPAAPAGTGGAPGPGAAAAGGPAPAAGAAP